MTVSAYFTSASPTWNLAPHLSSPSQTIWTVTGLGSAVSWQSSDPHIVTVTPDSTDPSRATLRTVGSSGLGPVTITATNGSGDEVSGTCWVGGSYSYDSIGTQYAALSKVVTPTQSAEIGELPTLSDMQASGAFAYFEGAYVLDVQQLKKLRDSVSAEGTTYYSVTPYSGSNDLHSDTATVYAYPPDSVTLPTGDIYRVSYNNWSKSNNSHVPPASEMNELGAGIAWDPVGSSNVTCYVLNWAQIERNPLGSGETVFYDVKVIK